jgi:hypothetical protein
MNQHEWNLHDYVVVVLCRFTLSSSVIVRQTKVRYIALQIACCLCIAICCGDRYLLLRAAIVFEQAT